jgi:hypothetical protein
MFKNKRTPGLGVALGADGILIGSPLQLLTLESAMRIMAIAAGNQPFIHFVVEGLGERRFYVRVAGVAKLGLCDLEQTGLAFEVMHAVTVGAAYLGVAMRRAFEIGVRSRVAGQTACADFFSRGLAEDEDLGFVAATRDVLGARSMATFAPLVGGWGFLIQRRLPVRRLCPLVIAIFMTAFAGVGSDVLGSVRDGPLRRGCARLRASLAESEGDDGEEKEDRGQNKSTGPGTSWH